MHNTTPVKNFYDEMLIYKKTEHPLETRFCVLFHKAYKCTTIQCFICYFCYIVQLLFYKEKPY